MRRADGRIVFVAGKTGCGKTEWIKREVRHAQRLLVWDSKGDFVRARRVAPVYSMADLHRIVVADVRAPAQSLALGWAGTVTPKVFDSFCRLAWVYLRAKRSSALVVEELADVTTPGKAPAGWGEICRKSREYGSMVYAASQRPAESDKTVLGNASLIHGGQQAFPRDRAYMAEVLDVPAADINKLLPLDWIERDMSSNTVRRGRLAF